MIRLLPLLLAAVSLMRLPPYAAAEVVRRCPENTRAIRTADARKPWACVLTSERYRDGIECPKDYEPVTSIDPLDPFKCARSGLQLLAPRGLCPPGHQAIPTSSPDKDFDCEKIEKGFRGGPRCPRGTHPVPTPGAMRPFKCVHREKIADPDPVAVPSFKRGRKHRRKGAGKKIGKDDACPKGTRKVKTEDPFDPFRCVSKRKKGKKGYRPFRIRGQVAFDVPRGWHLTNGWKDEIPSIYLLTESGIDGRPVSLSVSRRRRLSPSFQDMRTLIRREKDWRGAKAVGREKVGRLPALHFALPKESATVFLETGDGYYVISYSAPGKNYERYLPAYKRLLKSFKHLEKKKKKKVDDD